ncbi:MAG: HNH endonuclease [Clostridiales bacterium]|nr:HNH endonuclease [Clostridiales bacterium]
MRIFSESETYKRIDIHEKYGGQRQGGISTPALYPYIFIFTGGKGEIYGYRDSWQGDLFLYTGEGQRGDMVLKGGNRAILESNKNNEQIFLFKYKSTGFVEYMGEMECIGYRTEIGYDIDMHKRKVIIFELKKIS